jgi:hypothetical protein
MLEKLADIKMIDVLWREKRAPNRTADRPVGGVCGEGLTLAPTDSKALNRLKGAQLRKFG